MILACDIGRDLCKALGFPTDGVTRVEIVCAPDSLLVARIERQVTAEQLSAIGEIGKRLLAERGK